MTELQIYLKYTWLLSQWKFYFTAESTMEYIALKYKSAYLAKAVDFSEYLSKRIIIINTQVYKVRFCLFPGQVTPYSHRGSSLTMAAGWQATCRLRTYPYCAMTDHLACIQHPYYWYKVSALRSFDSDFRAAALRLGRSQCIAEDSLGDVHVVH